MQTQNEQATDRERAIQAAAPRKQRAWLTGLGAFIVVLLVIGASILVFAKAGQRQGSQPPPATGQWKQVQSGYIFLSMQAAPSNPAMLYACATTQAAASNIDNTGTTILRSTDFGDHWQNIGASLAVGSSCELAVSSTDANDIYALSVSNASQTSTTLKHSTDGGQTWATITPTLRVPSPNPATPWFVQQLRYDGHALYGVQWVTMHASPIQGPPAYSNRLPRLVTSADGGKTWSIIDNQLTARGLGAQAFVLDPAHNGTIYEIAGRPWFPIQVQPVPTKTVLPAFGTEQQLFKSSDNGAHWQSLLTGLPFGSQVQLASDNPGIIYAGGIRGPLPLVAQSSKQPNVPTIPTGISAFNLQISKDGGASWQSVATPPDEQTIQSWHVSADGHLYTSPTIAFTPASGSQPTAIVGTAVPVEPTTRVIYGTPLPGSSTTGSLPDIHAVQTTPPPVAQTSIQSYDPSLNAWSKVTTPPASGNVLQVTPATAHGGAILWFMGIAGSHYELYRYNV